MLKRLLMVLFFLGFIFSLSLEASALACGPDTGDTADCTATPTRSAVGTGVSALNAPNSPVEKPGNGSTTNSSSSSTVSMPLSCLLPDDSILSNALGVPEICPAAPVRIATIKIVPTPVPTPKAVVAAAAPTPKGDTPATAKTISDALQTLDAGGVHWYKIDNGQNFYLDVWLDANGQSGITFAMFSPEQTNALGIDTIPKGRGGPAKNQPHDLLWKGSFATGTWYVLVRNYNSTPVQYKLGTEQSTTDRNCVGFWEVVNDKWTWWVDCGHYGIGGK